MTYERKAVRDQRRNVRSLSYRALITGVIVILLSISMTADAGMIARGSESSLKVVKDLARAFKAKSNVDVTVEGGGSSKGAKDCASGEVQIGLLSRDLKNAEKAAGLISHRYAVDGVAVIVNLHYPADGTTIEELKAIYTGASTTLDGHAILPFNRPEVSGTRAVFKARVLGKNEPFSDRIEVKKPRAGVDTVSTSTTALYYTSAGANLNTVKVLRVNGLRPTRENLRSGTYPITRPLIMVTRGRPNGEVKQFMDFVFSPEGRQIIQKRGYVAP